MLPHRSHVYSAPVASATAVVIGDALVPNAQRTSYLVATTANRGTARSEGVALEASLSGIASAVEIQQSGTVDALITGLGAGAATWVRVSALGRLERAPAPVAGDDIIGTCEADGRLHLFPGALTAEIITSGIAAQDEGAPIAGGPFTTINVTGEGAEASDGGGGVLKIDVPVPDRVTPLDANHLHAWELTETSGDFADTGSSATPVSLVVTANVHHGTPGPFGPCPTFGQGANGLSVTAGIGASALISAFADLPAGALTLECWYRSFNPGGFFLIGADSAGASGNLVISGNTNQIGADHRTSLPATLANFTSVLVSAPMWNHIAYVYNPGATGFDILWNGEHVRVDPLTGNTLWANGTTPRFSIASSPNSAGQQLVGQLSRVRLSNIARSQAYLREVYRKGMGYPA